MITAKESGRTPNAVQLPHHELQIVDSWVTGVRIDAHSTAYSTRKEYKPEQQPVMCDFDIVKHDTNQARFYVSLLLEMENSSKTNDMLSFSIASVTEFEFRPKAVATSLPEDEQIRWHLFSTAVATALSMTRGHLATYLAPTNYRGYYLPMLNLQELVDKRYAPAALPSVPSTAPSERPPTKPKKAKE
jgi:hypothetical protein